MRLDWDVIRIKAAAELTLKGGDLCERWQHEGGACLSNRGQGGNSCFSLVRTILSVPLKLRQEVRGLLCCFGRELQVSI